LLWILLPNSHSPTKKPKYACKSKGQRDLTMLSIHLFKFLSRELEFSSSGNKNDSTHRSFLIVVIAFCQIYVMQYTTSTAQHPPIIHRDLKACGAYKVCDLAAWLLLDIQTYKFHQTLKYFGLDIWVWYYWQLPHYALLCFLLQYIKQQPCLRAIASSLPPVSSQSL
jgi:hypothetical protein